jgi:hypothetical protein
MATSYRNEVAKGISKGNFPFIVPSLSDSYVAWKASHGYPTGIGRLKGDLLNSLVVMRGGAFTGANEKGWFGGVNPNAIGAPGKNWNLDGPAKLVLEYGRYLEYGTKGTYRRGPQPARPIFGNMRKFFVSSGLMLKEAMKSLTKVRRAWR